MILLKARFIVTFNERNEILENAYIGINEETGKIEYVGRKKPEESYDEVIDLPHHIVLPGFINGHTHIPMVILRGLKDDVDLNTWLFKYIFPAEDKLKPIDVYYGALQGIAEMIECGTTFFIDMYFFEEEIAKAVLESGIRAILSRGILDSPEDRTPETEIDKSLRFLDFLKSIWARNPESRDRLFFALGPHAPYTCSRELFMAVRDLARKLKDELNYVWINTHVAETNKEVRDIQKTTGKTPVEYLDSISFLDSNVLMAHAVWVTDNDIKILSRRGVTVIHNPTSNLKLGSGIAPITKMLEEGVKILIGTDGAASNNRLDILWEARLTALLHKGVSRNPQVVPAEKVLRMLTIDGARALGLENLIGSIEVGKQADLVVLNLRKILQTVPFHDIYSMIIYAADLRIVEKVMVKGKWLYNNGEFLALRNIDTILDKIANIRSRIEEEIISR
ncbi:MAG: amidohydrolase [Candidatus Njordarchaeales archaeon]